MPETLTPHLVDEPAELDGEPPPRLRELARGEQLMLWSLRAVALGHADCPALQRSLEVVLGSSAEEAFTSLVVAVRTLAGAPDEGEVRERLETLVEPTVTEGLLMTLQTVTSALQVNGFPLPGRRAAPALHLRRLH